MRKRNREQREKGQCDKKKKNEIGRERYRRKFKRQLMRAPCTFILCHLFRYMYKVNLLHVSTPHYAKTCTFIYTYIGVIQITQVLYMTCEQIMCAYTAHLLCRQRYTGVCPHVLSILVDCVLRSK